MTEAEWLACENPTRLFHVFGSGVSTRKYRLLQCARMRGKDLPDERTSTALEVAERYADGHATDEELSVACAAAQRAHEQGKVGSGGWYISSEAVSAAKMIDPKALAREWQETIERLVAYNFPGERDATYCDLIRDVFGNPYRAVPFRRRWRTDTALAIARQMYDSRDFGAMPILADALQDAGCVSEGILNHCRAECVTHVRGCWVVDLVLGKQ